MIPLAVLVLLVGAVVVARLAAESGSTHRPTTTAAASPSATVPATTPAVTAAIADLRSGDLVSRLGAIATLGTLMHQHPADQPQVVVALSAFIRAGSPEIKGGRGDTTIAPEIQRALAVLAGRTSANDRGAVVDLRTANLYGANLVGADLSGANLTDADLTTANLDHADLHGADLTYAYLGGADVQGITLVGTDLTGTSLVGTPWCHGSAAIQPALGYTCKP